MYIDYTCLVKNEILTYVPQARGHFFAIDRSNDKLVCLKSNVYLGSAFLQEKILYTEENHFKSAAEVFSFHPDENIADPISLYLLLNYDKELFVAPGKCNVLLYGIEVMKNALYQLFTRAMQMKVPVQEALDILDSSDVSYTELVNRLPNKQFYRSVKSANVHTSEPITIPIGNADIRFTQTHLAEIQAILQTNKQ